MSRSTKWYEWDESGAVRKTGPLGFRSRFQACPKLFVGSTR